jgi:hypothetical protein
MSMARATKALQLLVQSLLIGAAVRDQRLLGRNKNFRQIVLGDPQHKTKKPRLKRKPQRSLRHPHFTKGHLNW